MAKHKKTNIKKKKFQTVTINNTSDSDEHTDEDISLFRKSFKQNLSQKSSSTKLSIKSEKTCLKRKVADEEIDQISDSDQSSSEVGDSESDGEQTPDSSSFHNQMKKSKTQLNTMDDDDMVDFHKMDDVDEDSEESNEDGSGEIEEIEAESRQHQLTTSSSDNQNKLRKELADLSFQDLQKLKDKVGIKVYNQAVFGTNLCAKSEKRKFKRENKNRPMEMSSKRPVSRLQPVVAVKKKVIRDPRFDDLSGQYNEEIFNQSYSFLNEVKQKEKLILLKKHKKEKNPLKKEELEYLIKRMSQQEKMARQKEEEKRREKERKKKERELVAQGKKAFYLKSSEKKKLELAAKYQELKRSGKMDKYLNRKRKKNAMKEKRKLPQHRTF